MAVGARILKQRLTILTYVYRMSNGLSHNTGLGGGTVMCVSVVVSFVILLVLVLSRGSRPRPIGA